MSYRAVHLSFIVINYDRLMRCSIMAKIKIKMGISEVQWGSSEGKNVLVIPVTWRDAWPNQRKWYFISNGGYVVFSHQWDHRIMGIELRFHNLTLLNFYRFKYRCFAFFAEFTLISKTMPCKSGTVYCKQAL